MKRFVHILILIFSSQWSIAQDFSNLGKHEVGFNVNALLESTIFHSDEEINFAESGFVIPPTYSTLVTYRYYYAEKFAMRLGIGVYSQEMTDTFSNFFATVISTISHRQF